MKNPKLKEYLMTATDPEILADFLLLVLWGVIVGSFIGVSSILLSLVLG